MLEVFHRYQLVILSKKYGAVKIVYFPFKINFHLFFFFSFIFVIRGGGTLRNFEYRCNVILIDGYFFMTIESCLETLL